MAYQYPTDRKWLDREANDGSMIWGEEQSSIPRKPRMSFSESVEGQGVQELFATRSRRELLDIAAYLTEKNIRWPVL